MFHKIIEAFEHLGKSFKAGDDISHEDATALKNTEHASKVNSYDEGSRERFNMRDVTPNKPLGVGPDMDHATVGVDPSTKDLTAGNLSESADIYRGGAEAKGVIENPSPAEREKEVNADTLRQPGDQEHGTLIERRDGMAPDQLREKAAHPEIASDADGNAPADVQKAADASEPPRNADGDSGTSDGRSPVISEPLENTHTND